MIGWLLLNWRENVSLVTMMNRTIKKQRLLKVGLVVVGEQGDRLIEIYCLLNQLGQYIEFI